MRDCYYEEAFVLTALRLQESPVFLTIRQMKILHQHPLALLGLGLLLGGGITHTAWLLRSPDKPEEIATGPTTGSSRRSSTRSSSGKEFPGAGRIEEKARMLADKDLKKAWAQAMGVTNFKERSALIGGLMREWGRQDPAAALEMAGTLSAGQLRQNAFNEACAGWASSQPEAAAKWAMDHLSGPLAEEVYGSIAAEWAANNPAAAAAWVSGLPDAVLPETATVLISIWAEQDPRAAAAWINSFSDEEKRSSAMAVLASEWGAQAPDDAARWVDSQLGDPNNAGDLAEALIGSWGAQDPHAAGQWITTLPGELQSSAAATLVSLWAGSDPKGAAEWVAKFPEGEARAEAIAEIASTWATHEPEKAVAWTLGLPDSPEQRDALDDAVRTWTDIAPGDLGKWVDQQPQNEATDHLRTVAATTLVEDRPEEALAMVAKISDPELRSGTTLRLLKRWAREDPSAARAWAEQAQLPAAITGQLKASEE